ncbi:transposable element Tcb1 transposase [Trichonephila clavipes]|nr:transposable element Tcb1 transposase [Trichonephila clavipes]
MNCLTACQKLPLPCRSPYPSPIKHIWDMMGRRLHLPGNVDDLARQLEQIWQEMPQETIRMLYHSMPRRVAACISARESESKEIQRKVSMRQIALDIGISDRSMRRIAKAELGLKSYKLRKVQLLTGENKLEKLFTVQQVHNSKDGRIWSVDAPSTSAIVEHRQYPKSVIRRATFSIFVRGGKTTRAGPGTRGTLLKLLYFRRTKSISEMQIGCFNKTLHEFARPKRYKNG